MLTQKDLDEVEKLFDEKFKEELSHLPNRDEWADENAKLMAKLDKIDINTTVVSSQVSGHSDRIENLEKIHPNNAHASVV